MEGRRGYKKNPKHLTAYKLIPLINSEAAYMFFWKVSKQIKFHFSSYLHLLPDTWDKNTK